jgi:uncharacterized protein YoxC
MTANINMRGVQESVEDNAKMVRNMGRKALLTYLGVLGMGYDFSKSVYADGWKFVEKAEKRGEKVEDELRKYINAYQQDFPGEVKKLAHSVEENVTELAKDVQGQADRLGRNVEKVVTKYVRASGVPQAVEDIQVNGKTTSAEAVEATREAEEMVTSAVDEVWYGYDNLSVKDILAGLENKSFADLELLREHELNTKNRVTVLREIDARLQAMTS